MTAVADKTNLSGATFTFPFGMGGNVPPLDPLLLGGKGKGLAEMASLGFPVPPGFIISTEACKICRKMKVLPDGLEENILSSLTLLENYTGKTFGKGDDPLVVSVRSGAPVSMPGMMDTILNLGLSDRTIDAYIKKTANPRLAWDNYRRLVAMYGEIVKGIPKSRFDEALSLLKLEQGIKEESEMTAAFYEKAVKMFLKIYEEYVKEPFPQEPKEQLFAAVKAVFQSWDCERAILYRELNRIPSDWGTAVIVQLMVFGNKNEKSATGVAFTRNPSTGEKIFYGEFLPCAQGEEVVLGVRTPHPINLAQKKHSSSNLISLQETMPEAYKELESIVAKLEKHFRDMQDIEFTIDDGKLYMLQTRTGKRTGVGAVRMAVEMLDEGLIDQKTALRRVKPEQLLQLLAPVFDEKAKKEAKDSFAAKGLNAGPGAASGVAVFSSEKAVELNHKGVHCILVRKEANPNDFPGMVAAIGILTMRGGSTSHAAVVARGMGKPCIVGCGDLTLNEESKTLTSGNLCIKEGDPIAIDGTTGEVFFCGLKTRPSLIVQALLENDEKEKDALLFKQFERIMQIADKVRKLKIRANADTPKDGMAARAFGAEGIGLCRTEHMFLEKDRLFDVRRMFFSREKEERQEAIDRLLPHQKQDFLQIFKVMDGLPVTIRLLDPPLHEFMPKNQTDMNILGEIMHLTQAQLQEIHSTLLEHNPMLGHRGCRLGITYPEVTEMQARAMIEAAVEASQGGIQVYLEIMIPLVGIETELQHQKMIIEKTAESVFQQKGIRIPYSIGTMIELPRAALIAGKIAKEAEFFSFGTNDLTQTAFGISRDDSGKFLGFYTSGVPHPLKSEELYTFLAFDPFQTIDEEGVGELMEIAIQRGKKVRPNLKCGICGEHGGDPHSIAFCNKLGLDYVSCSPYRIIIARLAAAQANI